MQRLHKLIISACTMNYAWQVLANIYIFLPCGTNLKGRRKYSYHLKKEEKISGGDLFPRKKCCRSYVPSKSASASPAFSCMPKFVSAEFVSPSFHRMYYVVTPLRFTMSWLKKTWTKLVTSVRGAFIMSANTTIFFIVTFRKRQESKNIVESGLQDSSCRPWPKCGAPRRENRVFRNANCCVDNCESTDMNGA